MIINRYFVTVILFSTVFSVHAAPTMYLDEKTAFCETQRNLGEYLQSAQDLDIDSMNDLVIIGKCHFIPDGEYLAISSYQTDEIDEVPVIAFQIDDMTLWTFKALINFNPPAATQQTSANLNPFSYAKID